jgi:hypothetical protein
VIAETPNLPALADSYVKGLFSSLKISDDRSASGNAVNTLDISRHLGLEPVQRSKRQARLPEV